MTRWVQRLWLALVLSFSLVVMVVAQANPVIDTEQWTKLAQEAETALDNSETTEEDLVDLRDQVADFRSSFDAVSELNSARIKSLREQIAALGPVPDGTTGTVESADVAATRASMNEQLSTLLVPVQRAETEYVRAEAIVGQIDKTLRERQAEQLLSKTPSPLNPVHWSPAAQDFKESFALLWEQPAEITAGDDNMPMSEILPVSVLLVILGLVFILRGQHWSRRIVNRLQVMGARGFGIWRFLASLLRIILPFAGLLLISLAAVVTGRLGPDLENIVIVMAMLGGAVLGMRWVTDRVFSRDDDEALILLPAHERKNVRFYIGTITLLIVIGELITAVMSSGDPNPASKPVLLFPITLLAALALYRVGVILRNYVEPGIDLSDDAEPHSSTLMRVVHGFGTGAVVIAIATPVLAALGYFRAADGLMGPYIVTLVLLGLVMALQRFAADIYGAITGQGEKARDALMPVLFGLILLLMVAPVLALAWGARLTDLQELWSTFLNGFKVGDSTISPTDFLTFAVIFAVCYVITRLLQSALRNNVLPKTHLDLGGQNAIVSGIGYIGIFLAALAAITGAGIDLSSLAIVAGALSVGIGFGLQNIVSNFVSGIILLIERPISEGDWIEVGGQMGYVRDISVRSTRIETFDRTDVIVPNADLVSGTVTNFTRGNTIGRVIIQIGVAYGTDTKKVEAILREIAEAQPMVVMSPPPGVLFLNFGADALEFEIRCVLRDVNRMMIVKNDINHAIAERFAKEGIEIPFAQRDVWLRNPEVLRPAPEAETEPTQQRENP